MDSTAWMMLGVASLLSLLLVATVITIPLRRLGRGGGSWGALLAALSLPMAVLLFTSLLLWVISAFPAAFGALHLERSHVEAWYLFWVILLLFNLSEGLGRLYHLYFRKDAQPAHGLALFLGRVVVVGASLLIVLQFAMDLSTSQLLTSTAVVATVLGIALREVLSNFLAGLSVHLAGTVQPAQWIAIGDKEGEIIQRNWRETRIRSTGGHIYIVPNSLIASSLITHMTWDSPLRRHHLDFPVSYDASPALVRQALQEAAISVPEVDRTCKWPDAMVLACKDNSMVYRLRFWSRTFHDRSRIEGDVQERVWYQLGRHGIALGSVSEVKIPTLSGTLSAQVTEPIPETGYDLLLRSGFVQRYLVGSDGRLLVDETALRAFATLLRRRTYGADEELFRLGDVGEVCYILLRGDLYGRTGLSVQGGGAGEFRVEPGEWVGEISVFSGLTRTATVFVKGSEAEVLEVSNRALHYLLSCHEEIARLFQQRLAQRSRRMLEELRTLDLPHTAIS
ncbi:MAG: mechanosensitive ion channel [Magnetococcus sp. DMHC-8]